MIQDRIQYRKDGHLKTIMTKTKPAQNTRVEVLQVTFTKEEKELLKEKANKAHMTMSAFIRAEIFN